MKQITCIVLLSWLMIACMNPQFYTPYKAYVWSKLKSNNLTYWRDYYKKSKVVSLEEFSAGSPHQLNSNIISSGLCMWMCRDRYLKEIRDKEGQKLSKGAFEVSVAQRNTGIRASWNKNMRSVKLFFDQD